MKLETLSDFHEVLTTQKPENASAKQIWAGLATSLLMQVNEKFERDGHLSKVDVIYINDIYDLAEEYEIIVPQAGVYINPKILRNNENRNSEIEAYFSARFNA